MFRSPGDLFIESQREPQPQIISLWALGQGGNYDIVPLPAVSKMLGHSSIDITVDDYGHLLPDEPRREIMARLERWHVDGHKNGHTLEGEGG